MLPFHQTWYGTLVDGACSRRLVEVARWSSLLKADARYVLDILKAMMAVEAVCF